MDCQFLILIDCAIRRNRIVQLSDRIRIGQPFALAIAYDCYVPLPAVASTVIVYIIMLLIQIVSGTKQFSHFIPYITKFDRIQQKPIQFRHRPTCGSL